MFIWCLKTLISSHILDSKKEVRNEVNLKFLLASVPGKFARIRILEWVPKVRANRFCGTTLPNVNPDDQMPHRLLGRGAVDVGVVVFGSDWMWRVEGVVGSMYDELLK